MKGMITQDGLGLVSRGVVFRRVLKKGTILSFQIGREGGTIFGG